ncbi:MAG: OmpA family protein [Croceivirga sp.]
MRHFILLVVTFVNLSLQAQDIAVSDLQAELEEELEFDQNIIKIEADSSASNPQSKITKKLLRLADEAFENMWYAEASKRYEEAIVRTHGVPAMQTLQKVADAYYYIGDMNNASKWFEVLFDNYQEVLSKDDLFKYTHVLKGTGRKQNADRILNIISEKSFDETAKSPSFLQYEQNVVLKNLKINTKYSEFGPVPRLDDKIVFASAADTGMFRTKRYKWNNQPFLDLYEAKTTEKDYELSGVTKLSKDINSKQHEASATFSPDGKTIYFTRNNDARKKKNKKNVNHLKIFVSNLADKWSDPKEVPFNSESYSTGHPALSPDGKKLYFVSDMPGGHGFTDLYVVDIDENGQFSEPKNLGPEINSKRKEMFPFVTKDNIYFSSDRKSGLGGLDIYQSTIQGGSIQNPVNLGEPFNSIRDDFSYMLKKDGISGYLASNRKGGKGDDDIYYFEKEESERQVENRNMVSGTIIDAITEAPVPNVSIVLFDANHLKIAEAETDENGNFMLENLISNYDYSLNATNSNYEEITESLSTKDNVEIKFRKRLCPIDAVDVVTNDNNETMFKTEAVYFNFDSYTIREDAKEELDRLANYLVDHQDMKLKIESHTDSRGKAAYNKYLSKKRAEASKDYLISKGVSQEQIVSAMGYGEEQLLNNCSDGASCLRQAHQLNRRSEFILVRE